MPWAQILRSTIIINLSINAIYVLEIAKKFIVPWTWCNLNYGVLR